MSIEGFSKNSINNGLKKHCKACGTANEHGVSFCTFCGTKLDTEEQQQTNNLNYENITVNEERSTPNVESGNFPQTNGVYSQYTSPVMTSPSSNTYGKKANLSEDRLIEKNGYSALIKTGDWMKFLCLSLLSLIPFVGTIILFIVYIVYAVKPNVAKSIQNYVRASFIFSLILVVSLIIIVTLVLLIFVGMSSNILPDLSSISEIGNYA